MIHISCLKQLSILLKENIKEDQVDNFIMDILNVKGTNSSFKLVFKELIEYNKNQKLKRTN